jgi:hypothetical protein
MTMSLCALPYEQASPVCVKLNNSLARLEIGQAEGIQGGAIYEWQTAGARWDGSASGSE